MEHKDIIQHLTNGELEQIIKEADDGKWISVEDRLPDEHKSVIVYVTRFNYYSDYVDMSFRQDGEWKSNTGYWKAITHWMPLPPPPKESKE